LKSIEFSLDNSKIIWLLTKKHIFSPAMMKKSTLFPNDSWIWYKWGVQGLVLLYVHAIYCHLADMQYRSGKSYYPDDSTILKSAYSKIEKWQFACRFGRTAGKYLRGFIAYFQRQTHLSNKDLRSILEGGNVKAKLNNEITVRLPYYTLVAGIVLIFIGVSYSLLFSLQIALSNADISLKILVLAVIYAIIGPSIYISYIFSIRPFFLIKKYKRDIELFGLKYQSIPNNRNQIILIK